MAESNTFYNPYSDLMYPMDSSYFTSEKNNLTHTDVDRIIEMAWEDKTPFEAIEHQFGLTEEGVRKLMKRELKFSSYKLWRNRVEKNNSKHAKRRLPSIDRFKSVMQRLISQNAISKRNSTSHQKM